MKVLLSLALILALAVAPVGAGAVESLSVADRCGCSSCQCQDCGCAVEDGPGQAQPFEAATAQAPLGHPHLLPPPRGAVSLEEPEPAPVTLAASADLSAISAVPLFRRDCALLN